MKLKVVLESRGKGCFEAYIPSLPGCISSGMNEGEALENIRTATLSHFGIEEVVHPNNIISRPAYKGMLTQMSEPKMSEEKKLATLTTLTGLFLMVAVLWMAGLFA